jgi:hypothetical protein
MQSTRSTRSLKLFAVALLAATVIGAVSFVLFARFSLTGEQTFYLEAPSAGHLSVFYGWPNSASAAPKNCFYLLVLGEGILPADWLLTRSTINRDIRSCPFVEYEWQILGQRERQRIRWNMWSDTIAFGSEKFSRKQGDVFVLTRSPAGKWSAKQCGLLGSDANLGDLVRHIRRQFSSDPTTTSIKFPKVDR